MPCPSTFTISTPRSRIPSGACDSHIHVFGPIDRYPLAPDRVYTPADALPADAESMLATLGLDRVVLVQASVYGTDNTCLIDGLKALGPRARGVAVIQPDIADEELDRLHAAGVRGVRLNIASGHDRPGVAIAAEMKELANRISALGWHLQLFVRPDFLPDLAPAVKGLPVDVVIDHMGLVPADAYRDHAGFSALLTMLDGGRTWIKVSGAYRVCLPQDEWNAVLPMVRALIERRPDRIVWGSDWPHPPEHGPDSIDHQHVMPFRKLDTAGLLDLLVACAPNDEALIGILVDNPIRLYGFE